MSADVMPIDERAVKMAQARNEYTWRANLACIATYKILEGNTNMGQFAESSIPFDEAANVAMKELRYYPKTSTNEHIIDVISHEAARTFIKMLVKHYSVKKIKDEIRSADIIEAISGIFRDGEKTIKDLAAITEELIKFADEN